MTTWLAVHQRGLVVQFWLCMPWLSTPGAEALPPGGTHGPGGDLAGASELGDLANCAQLPSAMHIQAPSPGETAPRVT